MNYGAAVPTMSTGIMGPATQIHPNSGCSISPIPDGSHFGKLMLCGFSGETGFHSTRFRSGSIRKRYENRTAIHGLGGQRMTRHRFHEERVRTYGIRHCFARARTATAGSIRSCRPEQPILQSTSNLPVIGSDCRQRLLRAGLCRNVWVPAGHRLPWPTQGARFIFLYLRKRPGFDADGEFQL